MFFLGLIVGVIIRYTSSPNATQGYATAVVTDNTTYYSDSPPDIVYINFSVRNTTNQLRIKYDLAGTVNIPVTEPPLERTVTIFYCQINSYFRKLIYLPLTTKY